MPVISGGVALVNKYFRSGNPESVVIDGLTFYLDPFDSLALSYIPYELEITALIQKYVTSESVAVDIGANIGYHALTAAKIAKQVVAFEPEPTNYQLLKKNIEANRFSNVTAVQKGLADRDCELTLHLTPDSAGGHSIIDKGIGIPITLTTLDEFMGGHRVDFIKMDIEGAEGLALKGMLRTLEKWKPVVISEFRPANIRKSGIDPDWFFKVFSDLGYSLTEIGAPDGKITDDTTHNYLFLP